MSARCLGKGSRTFVKDYLLCRSCGVLTNCLTSLLLPQHTKLRSWVEKNLSIEVNDNNGLPYRICVDCLSKLQMWISFTYHFKLTQKKLETKTEDTQNASSETKEDYEQECNIETPGVSNNTPKNENECPSTEIEPPEERVTSEEFCPASVPEEEESSKDHNLSDDNSSEDIRLFYESSCDDEESTDVQEPTDVQELTDHDTSTTKQSPSDDNQVEEMSSVDQTTDNQVEEMSSVDHTTETSNTHPVVTTDKSSDIVFITDENTNIVAQKIPLPEAKSTSDQIMDISNDNPVENKSSDLVDDTTIESPPEFVPTDESIKTSVPETSTSPPEVNHHVQGTKRQAIRKSFRIKKRRTDDPEGNVIDYFIDELEKPENDVNTPASKTKRLDNKKKKNDKTIIGTKSLRPNRTQGVSVKKNKSKETLTRNQNKRQTTYNAHQKAAFKVKRKLPVRGSSKKKKNQ